MKIQDLKPTRLEELVCLINMILFSTILWSRDFSRSLLVILLFIGIYTAVKSKEKWHKEQLWFSFPLVLFFVVASASYFLNDMSSQGSSILSDRYTILLASIPLLHLYAHRCICLSCTWLAFVFAAVSAGVVAIIDVYYLNTYRATGDNNPILFAIITLGFISVSFASLEFFRSFRFGKILFVVPLGFGILALLLTQSRGSWIALPIIFAAGIFFYLGTVPLIHKIVFVLLTSIVIPSASYFFIPQVQNRVDQAIEQVTPYLVGTESDRDRGTSVGLRIEMWKTSLSIFSDNKIIGTGTGSFKREMKKYVAENSDSYQDLATMKHKHAHNEYIHSLLTKGILGFISIILILTIHFSLFAKYLKSSYDPSVRSLAFAGCLIVVSYAIAGLTDVPFEQKVTLIAYSALTATLLGSILSLLNRHDSVIANLGSSTPP
jgi:O-antigen ligase